MDSVSSISNFFQNFTLDDITRRSFTETFYTSTSVTKLAGLPAHIIVNGLPTRRRPTALTTTSPRPSSQCSSRFLVISSTPPTFSFRDNPFFCPTPPWSPPPQELPPPRHRRKSFPQLSCSQATPLFSDARKRWYCNVCQDSFRDKYECERHIVNVGKRVKCLACGKNICARKDSRKRHYIKHCKKMDLGKDGGIRLEDAFIDV